MLGEVRDAGDDHDSCLGKGEHSRDGDILEDPRKLRRQLRFWSQDRNLMKNISYIDSQKVWFE